MGVSGLVNFTQGESGGWPLWAGLLLVALAFAGFLLITIGLLADKKAAKQWAGRTGGGHLEVSVLVAVVATPLYFVLKIFERES